jgi:hypothetical protein
MNAPGTQAFVHGLISRQHESSCWEGVPLPESGWSLRLQVTAGAPAWLEIVDDRGRLVTVVAPAGRPGPWIGGAWRGTAPGPNRRSVGWTVAVGHACPTAEEPTVTFASRDPRTGRARRIVVTPTRRAGLWLAAVCGLHQAVTYRQGSFHEVRAIALTSR